MWQHVDNDDKYFSLLLFYFDEHLLRRYNIKFKENLNYDYVEIGGWI